MEHTQHLQALYLQPPENPRLSPRRYGRRPPPPPLCTECLPRFKILRTGPSRENAQGLTQSCLFSRNKQHFFFFFLRKQLEDQKAKGKDFCLGVSWAVPAALGRSIEKS